MRQMGHQRFSDGRQCLEEGRSYRLAERFRGALTFNLAGRTSIKFVYQKWPIVYF
jgi:hypothetical protein